MADVLRVGIIGASAERGWAKAAHVPAVQGLAGFELAAVAAGTEEKGEAAAKAFGAKRGYGDGKDLIRDEEVDVVTIAVKVPDHRELVLAALQAGKHVYCEWPLGRNVAESEELAAAAQKAGVHAVIGLQTRANPAARWAQELLASGALGRVLSARILSTTMAFGPVVEEAMAFAENAENGVTLVSIQGGHTLDLATELLGPLRDVAALTTTQFAEVAIGKDKRRQSRSTPDHILVQAHADGGTVLAVEVAGGRPEDKTPFRCEVIGTEGELVLEGGAARGFQSGRLRLLLNGEAQAIDEGSLASFSDEAANVAGVYAALRDDVGAGHVTAPDFAHAVTLAQLMQSVSKAADAGP